MQIESLLEQYEQGPERLRECVLKAREDQYDLTPIPGRWSIRQVVCHVADFEPVYADRMKRVLVEDNPMLSAADPEAFAAVLQYDRRSVSDELDLITAVRRQIVRILTHLQLEDFQRTGVHSESGPLTLENLLESITRHIPHHVRFIEEKLQAMQPPAF